MKQKHLHSFLKMSLDDLFTLWIIAVVAVSCGFTVNQFRADPLSLVYVSKAKRIQQAAERIANSSAETGTSEKTILGEAHVTETKTEPVLMDLSRVKTINLDTFREMQKYALILDARPEIFHRHGHVPKAISLPRDDFEAFYKKQRARLEKHKTLPVAIYCAGFTCEDGELVASALVRLGFTDLHLYRGGWHGWTRAKLPEEKNL